MSGATSPVHLFSYPMRNSPHPSSVSLTLTVHGTPTPKSEEPDVKASTYTVMASYIFYIAAATCVGGSLASAPSVAEAAERRHASRVRRMTLAGAGAGAGADGAGADGAGAGGGVLALSPREVEVELQGR